MYIFDRNQFRLKNQVSVLEQTIKHIICSYKNIPSENQNKRVWFNSQLSESSNNE